MQKEQFTFDAESHTYRFGDRILPSVTQIIGAVAPRNYTCADFYLTRGAALHKCIHLLVQGKLVWDSVDERLLGRIKAFEKFMAESDGGLIHESEVPMFSKSLNFAGTMDARIKFQVGIVVEYILVDLKSSFEVQLKPQIGAYFRLCHENDKPVSKGLGLWLRDDGTYRTKWFTKSELRRAQQIFFNLLGSYNWMKEDGIL